MRHLKNKKIWSQGTFFKILGSPFPEEAYQDCPHNFFWVNSTHTRSQVSLKPKVYQDKQNIFAPIAILRLIFQQLQVHIIPRELVGVAIGH